MVSPCRIFLLSPAKAGGRRYSILLREQADFALAVKLRAGLATVGEIYSFISGLYFRGKMSYAEVFGSAPPGLPSVMVIVPGAGLVPLATTMSISQLRATEEISVSENNPVFCDSLLQAADLLDRRAQRACSCVLLGSIASGKYTDPLLTIFGERLLFPPDFVGRGDMSRGGLLLRHAQSGTELPYVPVQGAVLRGVRPPRLERWRNR